MCVISGALFNCNPSYATGVNSLTKMKCKDKSMTKLGLPINLHTLTRQSQLMCGILFHDGYSFALDHVPIGHMTAIDLRDNLQVGWKLCKLVITD